MPQTKEGAKKNPWLRFIHGEGRQIYLEVQRRAQEDPAREPPPPDPEWRPLLAPLQQAGWLRWSQTPAERGRGAMRAGSGPDAGPAATHTSE